MNNMIVSILHGHHNTTPMTSASPFPLQAFPNTDWATDPNDRRSTSCAVIFIISNPISRWSKKQAVVARSCSNNC